MPGELNDLAQQLAAMTDQLNEANDELIVTNRELTRLYLEERRVRKGLLRIHSATKFLAGILVLLFGYAATVEVNLGFWVRPIMGYLGVVAGLTLYVGQRRVKEHHFAEIAGVSLCGLWDILAAVIIASNYASGAYQWHVLNPFSFHPIGLTQPTPYAVIVYSGLTVMLWFVHLRAVLRDTRRTKKKK